MMYLPLGQNLLRVEPVSLTTFVCLWGLALSVFIVMELHKWAWALRENRRIPSEKSDR